MIGLDPGPEKTAFVVLDGGRPIDSGIVPNEVLRSFMGSRRSFLEDRKIAVEMIASYGMSVGASVFATCVEIGRYVQLGEYNHHVRLVYRKDIKIHLCGTMKAKDANIRQRLIDIWGGKERAIGKKSKPGPLYRIHSHEWAALAVAVYASEVPELNA